MSAQNHLRKQTNKPPGVFSPSESYIIMGHGLEGERLERFVVPDNCIIIAKAHPGDSATSDVVLPLYNMVGSEENHDLFTNPLENIREIINKLGSVVMYKPGDLCPNFIYTFASIDDTELFFGQTTNHWGLIQTPLKKEIEVIDISKSDTIKEWFPKLYSESILPTEKEVVDGLIQTYNFNKNSTVHNLLDLIVESNLKNKTNPYYKFMKLFRYTQKKLLDIDENGNARRPGVYYNFVCRNLHQLLNFKQNQSYMNRVVSLKNLPPLKYVPPVIQKRLLARRIIEAETKRKHLLPGTKYNQYNQNKEPRNEIMNPIFNILDNYRDNKLLNLDKNLNNHLHTRDYYLEKLQEYKLGIDKELDILRQRENLSLVDYQFIQDAKTDINKQFNTLRTKIDTVFPANLTNQEGGNYRKKYTRKYRINNNRTRKHRRK